MTTETKWTMRTTNNGPMVFAQNGDSVAMVYHPLGAGSFETSEAVALNRAARIALVPTYEAVLLEIATNSTDAAARTAARDALRSAALAQ